MADHIYIVECENGPVKVGITNDPKKRLTGLRTASPFNLSMPYAASTASGAERVERRAHQILARHRQNGEWFAVSVEDALRAVLQAADELGLELTKCRPHEGAAPVAPPEALDSPSDIKQARESLGLNQSQMAAALRVTRQSTVSDWETGKKPANRTAVELLRAYLDGYRPADWPK